MAARSTKVVPPKAPATPAPEAPEPATPAADPLAALDLAALAAGARIVEKMPTATHRSGGSRNPFIDLIKASHAEGKPREIGPVADDPAVVTRLKNSIRNGADRIGLRATVRFVPAGEGQLMVVFEARDKDGDDSNGSDGDA